MSSDMNVNKHTRAGYFGKEIVCPNCKSLTNVFHFAWFAVSCPSCKEMVDKNDWLIHDSKKK